MGPGRRIPDGVVVVEGGRVAFAGPRRQAPPAEEERDVDGFLMPAPADRHVHIGLSDPGAVLAGGVTAVRDLAWPPEVIFPLADASELTTFQGPLIRAAGPMLTGRGGYPTRDRWAPPGTGRELAGPGDAARAVAELHRLGAAAIKVSLNAAAGPTPTDAELAAVVEAAHAVGLPVTAHCEGPGQVERALGAGIDELAHAPWTERVPDAVLAAAARTQRWVSTLDIHSRGAVTPELRVACDNVVRFRAAGGEIVYGTDLGNGPIPPGIHVREALLLQEACRMTREDVLGAMIPAPLVPGAPADLVALRADPLHDLRALAEVVLVMRGGRPVRGPTA
ncbi:MAG TPA: amidohydrolase family protein [Actinomycetota bacterium]|nr:amidohydrolase family protein [Actinomycetota bacterium]